MKEDKYTFTFLFLGMAGVVWLAYYLKGKQSFRSGSRPSGESTVFGVRG
jgi:hypothetical protein